MYTNHKLPNNPSFRMTGVEFNTLINSITREPHGEAKPVQVGLAIRTKTSNLIAKQEDTVLFCKDLSSELGEGYFNIISNIQKMLIDTFGDIDFNVIKETVLMPVGAFEDQGNIIIYCNLIIEDHQVEVFSTNPSIVFLPIEEISLKNLDNRSIMILPTLTIVSE